MSVEPLRTLERSTLRERALHTLRDGVITGRFAPGRHLSEVELAAGLAVSRGTVREALRHLQQEGLVRSDARGRLSVRAVDAEEIVALYEVRSALETLAVRRVMAMTGVARARAVVRLDEALQRLRHTDGDLSAQVEADMSLHETLCTVADNPVLLSTWRGVEALVRATIHRVDPEQARAAMGAERHEVLIEAIARRTPDEAVALVEAHMREAADLLRAALLS